MKKILTYALHHAKRFSWHKATVEFLMIIGVVFAISEIGSLARVGALNTLPDQMTTNTPAKTALEPTSTTPALPEKTAATRQVPILMYHYIRNLNDSHDKLGYNLSVTPAHFDEQLAWLEQNHYQTYPLADFAAGKIPEHGKPIILTFDDGYADAYTDALPLLQKHHFTGTFFIVSHFINKPSYLTTDQIEGLKQAGMEIGAHTEDHIDLATAMPVKQKSEIENSKQASPVFAYPSGRYTSTTIDLVRQAGFLCAVTTHEGIASEKSALFELPRVRVSGGDDLRKFTENVQGINRHTRGDS